MSVMIRNRIPMLIAAFLAAYMTFDYYLFTEATRNFASFLQDWRVVIGAIATGVGLINLVKITLLRYSKKEPYWYFDFWALIVLVGVVIIGLMGGIGTSPEFGWFTEWVYQPLLASIRSMVFFNITYAFYRTFRIRNMESLILFLFATITVAGNAPIMANYFPWVVTLRDWTMNFPVGAGSRAFSIIIAIGIVAFAIRVFLRRESLVIGVWGE